MKAALVSILCVLTAAAHAGAQSRTHIIGGASYTRITEDDGALGDGPAVAFGIDRALSDRTYVELEVLHQRIARDLHHQVAFYEPGTAGPFPSTFVPLTFQWRGSATFATASLGRMFASGPVQPFVAGEIGLMHYAGIESSVADSSAVPAGLEAREPLSGRTSGLNALTFGGTTGIRVRVGSRWFARPFAGLRLARVGNNGPKYMLRYGVQTGVGW